MNIGLIDINLLLILLGAIFAILGLGLTIYGIFTWSKKRNWIAKRLDKFVVSEDQSAGNPTANQIILREIKGSLFSRTIVSWFKNIINLLRKFTPEKMAVATERKLTIAGNPANMHAGEFLALRLLVFFAGIILAFLLNRDLKNINMNSALYGIIVIVVFLFLPEVWLKGRIRSRQDEIRRGLPDALDMLSVCASAGLGFDQSLQKISTYWDTELGRELKRTTQEMIMGSSRAEALTNMSDRLDVDDFSRFSAIIIQAERIGMSYADVLHSQALQMRVLRQVRAREMANKLPAKMVLPLALLIFPAIMAVILGPAIPTVMALF